VRFLNLLSELGENSVVILFTHIVEDVSELCTRMAIIDQGEILLEAEPWHAVNELKGRIWRRVIDAERSPRWSGNIPSSRPSSSRAEPSSTSTATRPPAPGFEPSEPDLEDVYFSTMARHMGSRRKESEPAIRS